MLKRPELIFTIFAFIFGLLILFITPKFGVADEIAHFARAKEVSNGILYNNLPQNRTDNYRFHGASGYSPIMYTVSGCSLKLTQNFNENIQFYTGRIANLIIWILLIALAIHVTPIFKWAFFLTALLPMSIYEGMSYAADSFSNAFAFLYFAYMFKLIFSDKEFSYKKEIPLLIFFAIIGALCKGIIFPLFLLPFAKIKKHKFIIFLTLIILALSTAYLWAHNNFIALYKGVNYDYNQAFIIHQPIEYLKILFKTYLQLGSHLYGQALAKLGWQCIPLPRYIYHLITFSIIICLTLINEKYKINWKLRTSGLIIFITYLISLSCLMFCMCNPMSDKTLIIGIQGRYFISMFPALFLTFGGHKFDFCNKYQNLIKVYIVVFCFVLLCFTCYKLYDILKIGEQFFFNS